MKKRGCDDRHPSSCLHARARTTTTRIMKRIASTLVSTLALSSIAVAVACGGSDPTPNTATTAPSASVSDSAMASASAPIVASAAPSAEPPKPAGPTEEEKKKAAKQAEIDELPGLNHLFQTAKNGSPAEYGQIEETMSPVALDKIASWIPKQ